MDDLIFRSRRDRWVTAVAVFVGLLVAAALVPLFRGGLTGAPLSRLLALPVLFLPVVLFGWVLCGTKYVIDGERLRIRSGPFRWNIPIRDIRQITVTDDPSSAPALSLDRLVIRYGANGTTDEILVSPEDQERFVGALRSLNERISG